MYARGARQTDSKMKAFRCRFDPRALDKLRRWVVELYRTPETYHAREQGKHARSCWIGVEELPGYTGHTSRILATAFGVPHCRSEIVDNGGESTVCVLTHRIVFFWVFFAQRFIG